LSGYSEEHFSISKTELNNKSHIKLYISPTVKSTLTLPKHYIRYTLRDFLKVMYLHECTYTTCVSGGDVSSGSRVPRVCVCSHSPSICGLPSLLFCRYETLPRVMYTRHLWKTSVNYLLVTHPKTDLFCFHPKNKDTVEKATASSVDFTQMLSDVFAFYNK